MGKILVITVLTFFFFSSCFLKPKQQTVVLPDENTASFSGSWAVVINPYVSYTENPDSQKIAGHGRMGDIERVTGKHLSTLKGKTIVWYGFEKGWLHQNAVNVYDNKLKAEKAASKINQATSGS